MMTMIGVSIAKEPNTNRGKSSAYISAMKRRWNEEEGREGRAKKEEELLIGWCTFLQRLQSSPKKTPSILHTTLDLLHTTLEL